MINRHTKLLEFVDQYKRITVAQLAARLKVSQVTVRKDLALLEEKNLLTREHGFAVMLSKDDIASRLAKNYQIKHKIAEAAAALVNNGETVMIESGSCCALLAKELAATKRDITIITNSAFIAAFIRQSPFAKIVLLGGDYQCKSQVLVGPMTKKCAQEFYVDKLFAGTDGFTEKTGFTGNNLMRTEAIKAMAQRAKKVVLLTESSKFSRQGVVAQFMPEEIDFVFTDSAISPEISALLTRCNVNVNAVSSNHTMSEE